MSPPIRPLHRDLIASLDARENVAMPMLLNGVARKDAFARADELLTNVGLAEPPAGPDHIQAEGITRLLRELRDVGRVIVVSTHDAQLVPIADKIVNRSDQSSAGGRRIRRRSTGRDSVR